VMRPDCRVGQLFQLPHRRYCSVILFLVRLQPLTCCSFAAFDVPHVKAWATLPSAMSSRWGWLHRTRVCIPPFVVQPCRWTLPAGAARRCLSVRGSTSVRSSGLVGSDFPPISELNPFPPASRKSEIADELLRSLQIDDEQRRRRIEQEPQGTQSWLDARKYRLTASNFGAAAGRNRKSFLSRHASSPSIFERTRNSRVRVRPICQ
jgi:hypothetical protein